MATNVQFRKPVDPALDLATWFSGQGYTLENKANVGECVEVTLTENLDATQKTNLAAALRDEVTDPVIFS